MITLPIWTLPFVLIVTWGGTIAGAIVINSLLEKLINLLKPRKEVKNDRHSQATR